MKVYNGLADFIPFKNPVISIGTFDGVHVGHKIILNRLINEAERLQGESLLITLWPHPRMIIEPDNQSLKLLNTMPEKRELLQKSGLQHLLILPFSIAFSRTTPQEFIRDILVQKLQMKKIVIGYDHHFGRNREGSLNILQQFAPIFNFDVEEIPPRQIDDINVSSTKIRNAILAGAVDKAAKYLGYNYFINGEVIGGNQMGATLGFPTANIKVTEAFKLIPKDGVYAVLVTFQEKVYKGMMNIGTRPTFENNNHSLEVHIFDFNKKIYGENLQVQLIKYLRFEQKFESKEMLIQQLKQDELSAREVLKDL